MIKTTLKGNESMTVKESIEEIFSSLMDKGGFSRFTRISNTGNEYPMIVKKSVVKMVVTRD